MRHDIPDDQPIHGLIGLGASHFVRWLVQTNRFKTCSIEKEHGSGRNDYLVCPYGQIWDRWDRVNQRYEFETGRLREATPSEKDRRARLRASKETWSRGLLFDDPIIEDMSIFDDLMDRRWGYHPYRDDAVIGLNFEDRERPTFLMESGAMTTVDFDHHPDLKPRLHPCFGNLIPFETRRHIIRQTL